MIAPSTITSHATNVIKKKLQEIEKTHSIRILFAIESGSRAWGFPSTNSDYDVRFVYVRPLNDYISVRAHRDVIETELLHDEQLGVPFDLSGWDLRKALQLGLTSNAVLLEWLQSPIRYIADDNVVTDLFNFAKEVGDIKAINNHYFNLMKNTWDRMSQDTDAVNLKRYCYALRPALVLKWTSQFNTIPPMDMHTLFKNLVKDKNLAQEIMHLVTMKEIAQENDTISRCLAIDGFIQSFLDKPSIKSATVQDDEKFLKTDRLFRKIIQG